MFTADIYAKRRGNNGYFTVDICSVCNYRCGCDERRADGMHNARDRLDGIGSGHENVDFVILFVAEERRIILIFHHCGFHAFRRGLHLDASGDERTRFRICPYPADIQVPALFGIVRHTAAQRHKRDAAEEQYDVF